MLHPRQTGRETATLKLTRQEVDFALGVGSHIVDVEVNLEWCSESADVILPLERQIHVETGGEKREPAGVAVTSTTIAASSVSECIEAK